MKGNMGAEVVSALLALLFAYTGGSKVFGLDTFIGTMYNQPIPHWMALVLIWVIPTAEIGTAVCLIIARTQKWGLYASLILLITFTIYIGAILLQLLGSKTPCSCGGIFHQLTWTQHFFVNLGLLALTGLGLRWRLYKHHSPLNLS